MISEGFHPAETWHNASPEALEYYLQARWYMENLGYSQGEGSLISDDELPHFTPSERPELLNPEGYRNGRDSEEYAVLYRHPEGLPPAQAEVWIDIDEDGRFNPDPSAGERFTMEAHGTDYKKGVLYTVHAPADRRYVFRFADENWNPPVSGGLVPGRAGISYSHWE